MAPRGRARKPRLTRMDAAIDAMAPFGFSEQLVRRRVKELLKEYGGDEGWPFIEADAYKLVIDTILDEQEGGEESGEEGNLLPNGALGDERPGDCSLTADARSSTLVVPPLCSQVADAAPLTVETAEEDREGLKAVALDQKRDDEDMVDSIDNCDDGSGGRMQIDNIPLQSPPSVILSLPPATSPPRGRNPCHGWISSGDEEEDDCIELTPAPRLQPAKQPAQQEHKINGTDKRSKRKTRWDLMP